MNKKELHTLAESMARAELEVMKAKNADYTAGSDDPFANFRLAEIFGVPAEIGLLIRMLDKIQRIRAFLADGKLAVASEPVDDAIADCRNYLVLLQGLIEERKILSAGGIGPQP